MNAIEEYRQGLITRKSCHQSNVYLGYACKDGKLNASVQPCHANLSRYSTYHIVDLFTSLWYNNESVKELAKEYWEFITDAARSPWRSVLGGSTVIYNDDGHPIGLALKADNPAQVLGNLCIATRIPTENTNTLLTWKAYKDAGFDEYEALVLANTLTLQGWGTQPTTKWNHYPFNTGAGSVSLKNLRNGTPLITSKNLSDGGSYMPSNAIWNGPLGQRNMGHLFHETRTYKGMFPYLFSRQSNTGTNTVKGTVSFKRSCEIAKENRKLL